MAVFEEFQKVTTFRGGDAQMARLEPLFPKRHAKPIKHDNRRKRIEITFGRQKDRRRVATRHDRCPKVFLSAIALAATVMFSL